MSATINILELLSTPPNSLFYNEKKENGLGLATSFRIIRDHHGFITFDSKEGKGTTFYIYLPLSANS